MITDADAEKCMGFLEVARTMIDDAEVHIAGATMQGAKIALVNKALAEVGIASQNLLWAAQEIARAVPVEQGGLGNAATSNRVSARESMVSTEEVGRDSLLESAARTAKRTS